MYYPYFIYLFENTTFGVSVKKVDFLDYNTVFDLIKK